MVDVDGLRPEVSDWAENLAAELATARIRDQDTAPLRYAATADAQLAYEVLVVLARNVGVTLRPHGHAGGPIGLDNLRALTDDPLYLRAAQLVGFGAQGDADMVDALARSTVAIVRPYAEGRAGDELLEARSTLWAILEVLAYEPVHPRPPEATE